MKFNVKLFIVLVLFSAIRATGKIVTREAEEQIIIWDFGGIVFNPDKLGVAMDIGLKHFFMHSLMDMRSPNIQVKLFNFLHTMMADDGKFGPVGTGDGLILPTIMRHWQAGTITGPEIIKRANDHIKAMNNLGYFESEYERRLMQKTINAMFDPKILAENIYPLEKGVRLLKKCALAKNPDGSKKNRNIGFSNWDPLSYKIFKERYKDIFKYFDDIVISGDIGLVKPDKDAYKYVINKLNLKPENCLLIDDQPVNAKGAKKCKIATIVLESWDYKKLENALKLRGCFK